MANSGDETRLTARLKRLSHGLDFLKIVISIRQRENQAKADAANRAELRRQIQVGAEEVILNIINLHNCKDGYDYKLVSLPLDGLTDPSMPPMIEEDAESE